MNQYIHHIPGKIRIKNPVFKDNFAVLDDFSKYLEDIAGIEFITTNPITGSIVVHYDPETLNSEQLIQFVIECQNNKEKYVSDRARHVKEFLSGIGYAKVGRS